jgi:AP endonuclease-2
MFVVISGRLPIDHCESADMPNFEDEQHRRWLNDDVLTSASMVDLFRHFHADAAKAYTCWNTKTNARATNYGTRIDYIVADKKVRICGMHLGALRAVGRYELLH